MATEFIEDNLPCPHCGSSDAVALNDDGWYTCFSGNHTEAHGPKRWKEEGGTPMDKPQKQSTASSSGFQDDYGGHYFNWTNRKLTEATCRRFDVEYCPNFVLYGEDGKSFQEPVVVKWVRDDSGKRVWAQLRLKPDTKKVDKKGRPIRFVNRGGTPQYFFGQHAARHGGRWLAITEGHEDAMALSQALDHKYPVVSIPSGCDSVSGVFARQCNWLSQFEKIMLCFDSDEAGQQAMEKALQALAKAAPGAAHVMSLPYKDANECLLQGATKELVSAFWNAQKWQPPGFVDMGNILDESLVEPIVGSPYPWQGLTDITYGCRSGEIVCWVAASGIGKTSVLSAITARYIRDGGTIGCIYLEQPPQEMTQRILGSLYGRALHDPGVETTDEQREEAKQVYRECGGRVVFFDASKADSGANTWEVVRGALQHLAIAEGCTKVILDNFTVLLSHKDSTDTELHAICKQLKADAARLGVSVDAVSHVRKENKNAEKYEDGAFPSVSEIYGSAAIDQYCSFLFLISRNKMSRDQTERNTTRIKCGKDRFTGRNEGKVVSLLYNPDTSLLTEVTEDLPYEEEEHDGPPI